MELSPPLAVIAEGIGFVCRDWRDRAENVRAHAQVFTGVLSSERIDHLDSLRRAACVMTAACPDLVGLVSFVLE